MGANNQKFNTNDDPMKANIAKQIINQKQKKQLRDQQEQNACIFFFREKNKEELGWVQYIINECNKFVEKQFTYKWVKKLPKYLQDEAHSKQFQIYQQKEIRNLRWIIENKLIPEEQSSIITKQHQNVIHNILKTLVMESDLFEEEVVNIASRMQNLDLNPHKTIGDYYAKNTFIYEAQQIRSASKSELEISIQMAKFYQSFTNFVEKQMSNPEHPLSLILKYFKVVFLKDQQEKLNQAQKQQENYSQQQFEELFFQSTREIKYFIKLFTNTFFLFYDIFNTIQGVKVSKLINLQNIENFVMCQIFDDQIYCLLYEMSRLIDLDRENNFQKQIQKFNNYLPIQFGIKPEYCLDNNTINYFNQERQIKNQSISTAATYLTTENKEIIQEQIEDEKLNNNCNGNNHNDDIFNGECIKEQQKECQLDNNEKQNQNSNKQNSNEKRGGSDDIEQDESKYQILINQLPYQKLINFFKNINFMKSPVHKLKIIVKSSEIISECISDFYKQHKFKYDKLVEGDDVMNIYVYLMVKSHIPSIFTHLRIIESYISDNIMNQVSGYYFTTIQAACLYIENKQDFITQEGKE